MAEEFAIARSGRWCPFAGWLPVRQTAVRSKTNSAQIRPGASAACGFRTSLKLGHGPCCNLNPLKTLRPAHPKHIPYPTNLELDLPRLPERHCPRLQLRRKNADYRPGISISQRLRQEAGLRKTVSDRYPLTDRVESRAWKFKGYPQSDRSPRDQDQPGDNSPNRFDRGDGDMSRPPKPKFGPRPNLKSDCGRSNFLKTDRANRRLYQNEGRVADP
jgi:hypothetical protein